ncbi:YbaN family protein [Rhodovibrio salinarum]|uniref:DUF454 domain-containing protein n=1 Tax=Rhodovibrio salinarum TaxID=1087 RepID=A0A934V0Y5_9PROT|nr:YbaN family protein [Rhodovibrio salinarum]MBK1698428.1 DUF454 domain-containing protein [Rhodovibrio salinarum]
MSVREDKDHQLAAPATRWLWLAFGHCAVGLGVVGAFVPLLPTTPLLLLAAWAYARSSPALRHWLHTHPRFGRYIQAWQVEGAIPTRAKILAVAAMAGSFALAWSGGAGGYVLLALGTILSCVGLYVTTRPTPRNTP